MILEAFPAYTPEAIDNLPTDDWLRRAVQAEYVLSQFRQVPGLPSVDILLGVPKEVVEEKRRVAIEAIKKAKAEALTARRHRQAGEKGPIDPAQRQMFFEEHGRIKVESAFSGGMGVPGEMLDEVDFELPEDFTGGGSG